MFLHLLIFLPFRDPFFHFVLCSLRWDLEYTCTLNGVTFIPSMSDRWEQELQQCLEADVDFPPGDFIAQHPELAPRTISRRHASIRKTVMNRLKKRAERGVQSSSMANLNTPQAQAAKGSTGGARNVPQAQAAKGARNTPQAQAAKGARNTPQAQAAKGSTGGAKNTPEAQRDKGIVGGHGNTPEKQHAKASHPRSPRGVGAAKKELFRRKPPNHISLKSVREYWLDGVDVLYSPLFNALCHRCGQLLWGPVGAHKCLFPEMIVQSVPPTSLGCHPRM